jgi:hypothetical protein
MNEYLGGIKAADSFCMPQRESVLVLFFGERSFILPNVKERSFLVLMSSRFCQQCVDLEMVFPVPMSRPGMTYACFQWLQKVVLCI